MVTDIGGPLSHSSIVAREYGIPAVLGTGVATRRITSGQIVTVDGDAGRVILRDDEDGAPAEPEGGWRTSWGRVALGVGAVAAAGGLTWWVRRRRAQR